MAETRYKLCGLCRTEDVLMAWKNVVTVELLEWWWAVYQTVDVVLRFTRQSNAEWHVNRVHQEMKEMQGRCHVITRVTFSRINVHLDSFTQITSATSVWRAIQVSLRGEDTGSKTSCSYRGEYY